MAADTFIPYARHVIEQDDIDAVTAVLTSDALTGGPAVAAFEQSLCEKLGAPHAVVCANGTAALHLATMALGIGAGDTVIVPAVTFVATANAALYAGASVSFCDVDPDSGLMTAETLEEAIAGANGTVRAVYPVHINGQSADMEAIRHVADRHGLLIVEDGCHAIGGTQNAGNGKLAPIGACSLSDAATFSFHPAKTIAAGEGGAVTTRNAQIAERMRLLRNHGLQRDPDSFTGGMQAFTGQYPGSYELTHLGYNYRLPDILCALGNSQLRRLEALVKHRAHLVALYDAAVETLFPHVKTLKKVGPGRPAWHLYPVLIDFAALGLTRSDVMRKLAAAGIGTQVHYIPLHKQLYYNPQTQPALPGAEAYFERVLSLPLHNEMNDAEVDRVMQALNGIVTATPLT